MADISKIVGLNGTSYNLKDAQARADIEELRGAIAGGVTFMGETTTELTDGATTATVVINGESVAAHKGYLVAYGGKEFVYDGTKWIEMGDLSSLGALAHKDSASGTFTPAGSVSAPEISVQTAGATATVNSITAVGSLPSMTMVVSGETMTFGFDAGSLPVKGADLTVKTGDAAYQASAPSFVGTADTVTVS